MILTTLVAATVLSPVAADARIVGASLFKNGYAVVVREAALDADGEMLLREPPAASLGTLWVTATSGVKIDSVVATTIKGEVTTPLGSLNDLIDANVGKLLTIRTMQPGDQVSQSADGTILSSSGSLVVLDTEEGQRAIQKSHIVQIVSRDKGLVYQAKGQTSTRALRVTARGKGSIVMMSLERGLTWVPSYYVDISDAKKLQITSKATIMNDLGALEGIEVQLITGFPNVRYLNMLDPLTSGQDINNFTGQMMSAGRDAAFANAPQLAQKSIFAGSRADAFGRAEEFQAYDPGQLSGLQLEDLFFVTQKGVRLALGERGSYVQFQEQAEYEHVYTLDIPETGGWRNANDNSPVQPQSPLDVWHTLEFKNPSEHPLTTASAMTVKSGQIIGQDLLNYTAPKSKASLRITKALDVQAELAEEEVSRELEAIKRTNYSSAYDLVNARATVRLVNYKSEPVKLKVTKQLVGEVANVSNGGKATKGTAGLRAVNPNSTIVWTLDMKAGETIELKYDFKVYVQAR